MNNKKNKNKSILPKPFKETVYKEEDRRSRFEWNEGDIIITTPQKPIVIKREK